MLWPIMITHAETFVYLEQMTADWNIQVLGGAIIIRGTDRSSQYRPWLRRRSTNAMALVLMTGVDRSVASTDNRLSDHWGQVACRGVNLLADEDTEALVTHASMRMIISGLSSFWYMNRRTMNKKRTAAGYCQQFVMKLHDNKFGDEQLLWHLTGLIRP